MNVEEERVSESWQQYQTDGPGHKMLHRVGNGLGQVTQHIPQLA
jgi:hypothetical protein